VLGRVVQVGREAVDDIHGVRANVLQIRPLGERLQRIGIVTQQQQQVVAIGGHESLHRYGVVGTSAPWACPGVTGTAEHPIDLNRDHSWYALTLTPVEPTPLLKGAVRGFGVWIASVLVGTSLWV